MSVQSNKSQEPSMEEVLASIRRIISEEMENPSRPVESKPAQDKTPEVKVQDPKTQDTKPVATAQVAGSVFPWVSAPDAPAAPMPVAQPFSALTKSADAERHPFMPAQRPAAQPAPVASPAVPAQPNLANTDYLSSYFAEIAQKSVAQTSAPVVDPHSAAAAVKPLQPQTSPFAGIIPPAPVETVARDNSMFETSAKLQMVPAQPVVPVQQSAPAPSVDATAVTDVNNALLAAFVEANLLPHQTAVEAKPHHADATVQDQLVHNHAIQDGIVTMPAVEAPAQVVVMEEPAPQAPQPVEENSSKALGNDHLKAVRAAPEPEQKDEVAPEVENKPAGKGLMSDRAASAFAASLSNLTDSVKAGAQPGVYPRLDEFVAELMKPLVSDWIDQNLERIVEEAVRDEIKRVSKLARN